LIFKLAFMLIDGLGRPSTGVLQAPQQALLDLPPRLPAGR